MLVFKRGGKPAALIEAHIQLSQGRTGMVFKILEIGVDQAVALSTRTSYQQAGVAQQ